MSEAIFKVITASRRRLIKGATFYMGEMLSRALGRNLNKGETSSWGRRHPHSGGRDYNVIIFHTGADSSGERHISVTPARRRHSVGGGGAAAAPSSTLQCQVCILYSYHHNTVSNHHR